MKKILLLLLIMPLLAPALMAQDCDCGKVRFQITDWICKGKTPAGDPIYEGKLTIQNNTDCKFTLTEILQQVAGDVVAPIPISVPPNSVYSTTITYTDVPPHVAPGSTPYFIVVYELNDKRCKFEFPSDKIPACDQTCTCNDGGWLPFVATIGGISQQVACGHQFGLSCKDSIILRGEYLCKGDCAAKYSAVLVDAITNTVVQSYPSFSFPWVYQFSGPGNYYLEITPLCNGQKCEPCRFYFTVKDCPTNCECNDAGWGNFTARIGNNEQTVQCGHQFGLTRCDTFHLKGHYECKGDCEATYSAVLIDAVTNTVVQTFPSFNFTWSYQFPVGSYYLVITPKCGNKECQPCRFFFTVRDCTTTCDCNPNGWQPFTAFVNNDSLRVRCGHQFGVVLGSTVRLIGSYLCIGDCQAGYMAVLTNTATGAVVQTWNPLTWPWGYTFSMEGTYRLEIIPKCGDRQCQSCTFFFTVRRPII